MIFAGRETAETARQDRDVDAAQGAGDRVADRVVRWKAPVPRELLADAARLAGERRLGVVAQRRVGLHDLPEAMVLPAFAEDPAEPLPEGACVTAERVDERNAVRSVADEREQGRSDLVLAIEQHLLLGREVVEDGLAGDAGGAGDVVDGHRGEAAVAEQVRRRLGDRLAGAALLALAQAGHPRKS